jgi:hypothetical protein
VTAQKAHRDFSLFAMLAALCAGLLALGLFYGWRGGGAATSNAPAQAATGNGVVWKAGDPTLGRWIVANTYQCGTPVQTGSSFTFALARNGKSCGRNQLLPVDAAGDVFRLQDGQTYTWTFHYIDGTPSGSGPGMGSDAEAQSLIWQLHPYAGNGRTPSLGFGNASNGAQEWVLLGNTLWGKSTNPDYVWTGTYTPGESDDWKLTVTVSNKGAGSFALWRNGTQVYTVSGVNTYDPASNPDPWWNFGPYKWRWELDGGGGSNMTAVNCTITDMTLSKQ